MSLSTVKKNRQW